MSYRDPKSTADIDWRFDFHPATDAEKIAAHGSVRNACKQLAHFIDEHVPPGREKALALTHCEEAMLWANSAIARRRDLLAESDRCRCPSGCRHS